MQTQVLDAQGCVACPFAASRTRIVADEIGDNYNTGGVMLIGEAPGYTEDKLGRPFVGESGKVLEQFLSLAGLARADLYITNVVRCRPPKNKTPTKKQVEFHHQFVAGAIVSALPHTIITMGATALHWFAPKASLTHCHGQPFEWEGVTIFPMFHPAYAMRNPAVWPIFYQDWLRLRRPPTPLVQTHYRLGTHGEAAHMASVTGCIGFDLETTDTLRNGVFYPHEQRILGYSVSWAPGQSMYVPEPPQYGMSDVLADPAIRKVCHNSKFEWQLLKSHGITLRAFEDTKIMAYLLGHFSTHLKNLSAQVLGVEQLQLADVLLGRTTNELTPEEWLPYAAADADVTLRLWREFEPQLEAEGLTTLYRDFELPLVPILADAERRGVLLNTVALDHYASQLHEQIGTLEEKLHTMLGPINLQSGPQKKKVLFTELGLPVLKRTPTGQPVLDKNTMAALRGKHEAIPLLMEHAKLSDYLSDFVSKLPRLVDSGSVLHTSINQAGTWEERGDAARESPATGRLSSSHPNLMQIPKREAELAKPVRQAFIARPGYLLLSVDIEQEEPRLAAVVSSDENLKATFERGEDVYMPIAAFLKGAPLTSKGEQDNYGTLWRDTAKKNFLEILYGAGVEKVRQSHPDLTLKRASVILDGFRRLYPGIAAHTQNIRRELLDKGYVTTLYGRRRRLPGIWVRRQHEEAVRQGANHPIQGSGADVLKGSMVRLWGEGGSLAGLDAHLLYPIHDELIVEALEQDVPAVVAALRRMTEWFPYIELPVSIKVGVNWGDLKTEGVADA